MRPSIWGPKYWFILHTSSFRYPENPSNEDKQYMKNLILSLANLTLPCPLCRHHMREYLESNNLDKALESNEALIEYLWKFHNSVNLRTGKTEFPFQDFLDLYAKYETMSGPEEEMKLFKTEYFLALGALFVVIITFYLLHNKS